MASTPMGFWRRVCRAVTRTKATESDLASTSLDRCLTATDLALMGIGGMLGSGVYILTGEVAGNLAGPAAILSFLIAGVVSLLTALLFTECATRVPRTGASYLFTYVGLGELAAFLVGWNVILMRVFVVTYAARGWSAYFDALIGHRVQNVTVEWLMQGSDWDLDMIAQYPDIVGGAVALVAAIPIALGTALSAKTSAFFVLINIVSMAITFVVAMVHADFSFLTIHGFFPTGLDGVVAGVVVCLGAGYGGFESVLFSAEEAKHPSTGVPMGIICAFAVSILYYAAGALAINVLAEYQDIDPLSPFVTAFERRGVRWMGYVVGLGGLCSITGTVLSTVFCLARIVYAMARDGLLPACLGRTDARTGTPVAATMLGTSLSLLVCVMADFASILQVVSLVRLLDFIAVAVAVITLRYRAPDYSRDSESISSAGDDSKTSPDSDATAKRQREVPEAAAAAERSPSAPASGEETARTPLLSNSRPSVGGLPGLLVSEAVRWVRGRARVVVPACLCAHLLFECLAAALLARAGPGAGEVGEDTGAAALMTGSAACAGLALISASALLVLPQYGEGIPFRVPLMPYLPLLSILCNVVLVVQIEYKAWLGLCAWIAIGAVIYFVYAMDHSSEAKSE